MMNFAVRVFCSLASSIKCKGRVGERIAHLLIIEESVKRMVNLVCVGAIV